MQSWDGVRLGLLALGYSKVVWIHLHCVRHGLFRMGIAGEQDVYPCPTCQQACKSSILAKGFNRQSLPFKPELIVKPLSTQTRHLLLSESRITKPRRVHDRHTRKIRRATATSVAMFGTARN